MSLPQTLCHFDRPVSHNQTETRFQIAKFSKKLSKTFKLLDVIVHPNVPCYWAALAGAYNVIGRMQIRIDGVEASYYYTPEASSFLLPSAGDNDVQKCIYSQLHSSGNNVVYNPNTKVLELQRNQVDLYPAELRLAVLSNFLANIGCITDSVEIIINWNTDITKYLIPIDPDDVLTSVDIQMPYLAYETYEHSNMSQPEKFLFTEIIGEEVLIPAIGASNTQQLVSRLTNSFNQKLVKRILFQTTPQTLYNANPSLDANPSSDCEALYSVFGSYLSMAQKGEIINFVEDGEAVLTSRGVQNDAIKLATTVDSFKVNSSIVSGAHTHTNTPQLSELNQVISGSANQQLNSFFSWGCVNLNRRVENNFQVSYQRTSDDKDVYPCLEQPLILGCYGECQVAWVNGQKVYV